MNRALKQLTFGLALGLAWIGTATAEPFSFKDGDMVVLLGNTFIERAQQFGYLERELTLATGSAKVHFRNLGWSGDTVYGDARSYFGPPQEGFDRLAKQMGELQPNVVILCYGAVAAFEGEAGKEDFISGYERLLEMIYEKADPRETVLVSPPPAENLGAPLPDQSAQNERLALYSKAIGDLAKKRETRFVDLFTAMGAGKRQSAPLTDNGIHYTEEGYAQMAPLFVKQLGLTPVDHAGLNSRSLEELRQTIIGKNRLYFHRWRPANETYLHLFRAHEQGQNAKELPMFEPLVEAEELKIDVLKQYLISK